MFRFIVKDCDTAENFEVVSHFAARRPLQVHMRDAIATHVLLTATM